MTARNIKCKTIKIKTRKFGNTYFDKLKFRAR